MSDRERKGRVKKSENETDHLPEELLLNSALLFEEQEEVEDQSSEDSIQEDTHLEQEQERKKVGEDESDKPDTMELKIDDKKKETYYQQIKKEITEYLQERQKLVDSLRMHAVKRIIKAKKRTVGKAPYISYTRPELPVKRIIYDETMKRRKKSPPLVQKTRLPKSDKKIDINEIDNRREYLKRESDFLEIGVNIKSKKSLMQDVSAAKRKDPVKSGRVKKKIQPERREKKQGGFPEISKHSVRTKREMLIAPKSMIHLMDIDADKKKKQSQSKMKI